MRGRKSNETKKIAEHNSKLRSQRIFHHHFFYVCYLLLRLLVACIYHYLRFDGIIIFVVVVLIIIIVEMTMIRIRVQKQQQQQQQHYYNCRNLCRYYPASLFLVILLLLQQLLLHVTQPQLQPQRYKFFDLIATGVDAALTESIVGNEVHEGDDDDDDNDNDSTTMMMTMECHVDGTCSNSGSSSSDNDDHHHQQPQQQQQQDQDQPIECGLYMAESTIVNGGYGVFLGATSTSTSTSTTSIPNNTILDMYSDVVIQYIDWHEQRNIYNTIHTKNRKATSTSSSTSPDPPPFPKLLLRDYFWKSLETDAYYDANRVDSIVPGFGMLSNCLLGLVNHIQSSCRRRHHHHRIHAGHSSSSDRRLANAGAYSTYQDCTFTTTRHIPVGHEMFDNYGDDWFLQRLKRDKHGTNTDSTDSHDTIPTIPLTDDYRTADTIVQTWQQYSASNSSSSDSNNNNNNNIINTNTTITTSIKADIYDIIIQNGIRPHLSMGTQQILPNTSDDAIQIQYNHNNNENYNYNNNSSTVNNTVAYFDPTVQLINHSPIRSIQYLQQYGMCLDHIVVKPTILQLDDSNQQQQQQQQLQYHERGAFARRFLPVGTIVAPAPVIHLSKSHHLEYYHYDPITKTVLWKGYQLLLNYCYGHPSTSLVFFPYSHGVNLINHAPSIQRIWIDTTSNNRSNIKTANVGIRWSIPEKMKHSEWLQLSVDELLYNHSDHSGLMMEYYALRDIDVDEEIFYDYGIDWELSFQQHVELWERYNGNRNDINENDEASLVHVNDYISAFDYHVQCQQNISNAAIDNINANVDIYDCYIEPPSWIDVRCWIHPDIVELRTSRSSKGSSSTDETSHWLEWMAPDESTYNNPIFGTYHGTIDETFPCDVLGVSIGSMQNNTNNNTTTSKVVDFYRIRILFEETRSSNDNIGTQLWYYVTNVPQSAITMVDQPYTNNQLLRSAFRHAIQLPDNMIPDNWKDVLPPPTLSKLESEAESMSNSDDNHTTSTRSGSTCGLYMAESAIPFSGLGMYSGRSFDHGDVLFNGDVVIQVEDIDLNVKLRHWANNEYDYDEKEWLLNNYYWNPTTSIGIYEARSVQSIIPGFGMLANSHTGLVNAMVQAPTRYHVLDRGYDPGAGASTTYHNLYFDAKGSIEVGAELFVQYGDEWFVDREDIGLIPLSYDFKTADRVLKFLSNTINNITDPWKSDEMELFVDDFLDLARFVASDRPRLMNAFPKNYTVYQRATHTGTAALTVPNRVRTIEWLEENGRCLDNIRPDRSTIRQAGHGAFATRHIKKGDVIVPMPLVQVLRRHMIIYDGDNYADKNAKLWVDGKQLLLNYCYGHPDSSLLLFPYAPISNYINHNVSQSNSELRWSSLPNHHNDWLERTPDSLDTESHAGLIMELVATKDIYAGEEIFLNYGSRWEHAWNEHVRNFKVKSFDRYFTSSEALNQRIEWIKTTGELEDDPYTFTNADDIQTICFVPLLNDNSFVEKNGTIETYRWTGRDKKSIYNSDYSYPCKVIDRDLKSYNFDEAFNRQDSINPAPITYTVRLLGEDMIVINVPRAAIQFYDNEYMSDNSWRKAFRHEIDLPDHMVPPAWRDFKAPAPDVISTTA